MTILNCGIYVIKNRVNGKVYIGQSINLKQRLQNHKRLLKQGKHENSYLQISVEKHGLSSFEFRVLEKCSVNELDERERYWISKFDSMNRKKGYNLESGGNLGKVFSEERKKKITGKGNPMYGKKHSKEFVEKIKRINRGSSDRLTEDDVKEIKIKYFNGAKQSELSKEFNVTLSTINKIIKGVNWKWVLEELNEQIHSLIENETKSRNIKIKELWKEGLPVYKIAEIVGCDRRRVSKVLENDIEEEKKKKEAERRKVIEDFINGVEREEIIKRYNISKTTYTRIISPVYNKRKNDLIKKAHKLKKEGYLNKEIAEILQIHRTTVTEYLKNKLI